MKKVLKKILVLISIGVLIFGGIMFFLIRSLMPEREEYIAYNKQSQIDNINLQLEGIDLEKIRNKKSLIMEKTITEIQDAVKRGELTYEELTAFYLDRIKTYDAVEKGINSVGEINPKAIEQARLLDKTKRNSPVYGIPVLIKDNINTNDMATSGGTYGLKDFIPKENSDIVKELISNGAIILGKSNLSELANFMANKMPSGYSSKFGQTHNPFNPIELSPQGSSSGSGAAVAANFSAIAIGSETTGSIIAPAGIHSIVGYKPTKDLISTKGVIPLSPTMDTLGPMGKTVEDVAILFNAAIKDNKDKIELPFTLENLKGKRIGVKGTKDSKLVEKLEKAGAEIVFIELDENEIDNGYIIDQEFRTSLDNYLKTYDAPINSLSNLIEYNKEDMPRRAKYGQNLIETAQKTKIDNGEKLEKMVKTAKNRLEELINENKLDAISFVDNEGVILPAVAGYPVITVPMGFAEENTPQGATFTGKANEDKKLLEIAHAFEKVTNERKIPQKYYENIK